MKRLILFFSLFIMATSALYAQELSVKGSVRDSSNEALPGVSIIVKGTNNGTSTDFDGNYSISASRGDVLVFSFMGYKSKSVPITGILHNVSLVEDTSQLDEVVITAFGIKKKEKALGYAVQKISADELNMKGKTNVLESLQGKISGVQINKSSGSVGAGVDILIRGITSIDPSRDNQPIFIVDGVRLNNDTFVGDVMPSTGSNASGSSEQFSFSNRIGDINPDDIESLNVLKGAAATALYGSLASNGAIIITTKKGKIGKPKITISSSTSFRKVRTTPGLQKTYREGHRTSHRPGVTIDSSFPNDGYNRYSWAFYSWGVPYTDDEFVQDDGVITDLRNDKFYSPYDLFRTGTTYQYSASISGADEKFDYFLSAGRNDDQGVLPNTEYRKNNLRLKTGYNINDKMKLGASITYAKTGGQRGNGGDKSIYSSMSYWSSTFPINDYLNENGTQKNYTPGWIDNPRYFAETSNLQDNVNRWVGGVDYSWNIYEWMNLNYKAQIDNYSDQRNRFVPEDLDVGTQVGGFIVNENINYSGLESNLLLTFSKKLSDKFNSTLLVGNSLIDYKTNYYNMRGEDLNVPGINDMSNTLNQSTYPLYGQSRNVGVFGDLQFDYNDAIFLSFTGRNDWLSEMPAKNRSFFYPSVSSSFVLNELLGMDSDVLSFAKLRASWAQVGKGPERGKIGHYFKPSTAFPFSGYGGYEISASAGDPDLIPERTNTFEVGADLRFMKNRIRLDYSYYESKLEDQILPVPTAYSSGLSSYLINAGSFASRGHEVMLTGNIVETENFDWSTNINWSTFDGELTEIDERLGDELLFFDDRIVSKLKVGDKLGTLYGWVFRTVDGKRYVDADGKWVVTGSKNEGFFYENENEMVVVGNGIPDYILSLGNDLSYKKLSLNFLFEYKKGGDLYDRAYRNSIRNGNSIDTEFRDQERVLEGVMDDGNGGYIENDIPLMVTANSFYRDSDSYNTASEVLLQDGSWLKLRNIGLSYNFGNLKKLSVENAYLSVNANNVLLWTAYEGFDPEANQFSAGSNIYGYTGLTTPLAESLSLGLKIEF